MMHGQQSVKKLSKMRVFVNFSSQKILSESGPDLSALWTLSTDI